MGDVFVVPLRTDAARYSVTVDLDGTAFVFDLHWNAEDLGWYFDLSLEDGTRLLAARRVVIGFPLLARFRDSRLPIGELSAIDTTGKDVEAGLDELGARVKLLYFPRSELGVFAG